MQYTALDYEEPGEPNNFWHIYSLDNDGNDSLRGEGTLFTIKGPHSLELESAVIKVQEAIEAAVAIAERLNQQQP